MPYYNSPLLSAWPAEMRFPVGRPAPVIPPQILKHVKMVDFIGYSANPKTFFRNQVLMRYGSLPKFRSEQDLDDHSRGKSPKKQFNVHSVSLQSGIPSYYQKIEIQYSKFGVEDFDFGFYNKTEFAGLESHIRNSYLNPLLQMLFFIWPFRELVKTHIRASCTKEPCIACELGFLFRMLENSRGVNCQASNLLRAFGLVPQARALGLLEPEHDDPSTIPSFDILIQTSCRFILEQTYQEMGSDSLFSRLLGIPLVTSSKCEQGHEHSRETTPFIIDLVYPKSRQPFVKILQDSINRETVTRGWCSDCEAYQSTTQVKGLARVPNFMCINANISSALELAFWTADNGKPWIPKRIAMTIASGLLEIIDLDNDALDLSLIESKDMSIYDLRAVICEVKTDEKHGHLVSHINVSDDPENSHWCLFNDFSVQHVPDDVCSFKNWKIPCIVQFARKTQETSSLFFLSPVEPDHEILRSAHYLK